METILMEFGIKEGVFALLFIWLFIHQLKTSSTREEKLFNFLGDMKVEFSKLVGTYETLSRDVTDIKVELHKKQDKE
jgi:uncharacterized membrane protein